MTTTLEHQDDGQKHGPYKRHKTPSVRGSRDLFWDFCWESFENGQLKPKVDRDKAIAEFKSIGDGKGGVTATSTQFKAVSYHYEYLGGIMHVSKVKYLTDIDFFLDYVGADARIPKGKVGTTRARFKYAVCMIVVFDLPDSQIVRNTALIWGKELEGTHFIGIHKRMDMLREHFPKDYEQFRLEQEREFEINKSKWRLDADHKGFGL